MKIKNAKSPQVSTLFLADQKLALKPLRDTLRHKNYIKVIVNSIVYFERKYMSQYEDLPFLLITTIYF